MQESQSPYSNSNKGSTAASDQFSNFNTAFDLGLFAYVLKKNLLWVILVIGISVLGSFLYLRYTSPIYQSDAIIQIKKSNKANQLLNVDDYYETNEISAEIELLKSNLIAKNTINQLPLKVSYFNKGQFLDFELYRSAPFKVEVFSKDSTLNSTKVDIKFFTAQDGIITWGNDKNRVEKQIKFGDFVQLPFATIKVNVTNFNVISENISSVNPTGYYFVINNLDALSKELMSKVNVIILNPSAKTVSISVQENNSLKAKEEVIQLIEEFKFYNVERKKQSSKQIVDFLNAQISLVYEEQTRSEKDISSFKRENNLTEIGGFSSVIADRLNQLDETSVDLELQYSVLEQIRKEIDKKGEDIDVYELLPILVGSNYEGGIESLITSLNGLLLERQNKLYSSKEGTAPVKEIDYKIDIQKKLIVNSLSSMMRKIEERSNNIEKTIKDLEAEFFEVPDQEIELARKKRNYDINEKFYTLLIEKKTEYTISQQGFVSDVNDLRVATISNLPISPQKNVVLLGFLLTGILLSLFFVVIKYLLHNQITSITEITKHAQSNFGVLGIIPKYHKDMPLSQLVVNKNPKSLIAESFRLIRTNLEFLAAQKGPKVMAVTSTVSGEGKTFIAINLGGIIAFSGKKVIILDLDMRKPKIHKGFDVENIKGMSTILIGKDELKSCLHNSDQENLDFITAGPVPPNPSELILNSKLKEVLDTLKLEYDLIIVDNPPVGLVTDGIEVIKNADYPLYIFRSEYSRKNFVHNVDRLVNENGISKLSIVLNGVDSKKRSYGYGYGYGYGYYDDELKESKGLGKFFKRK